MQKLLQGLHIFQDNIFRSQRDLFENLAKAQRPEVLFISCSDSRIVPSMLTQTGPGDLFIMRNAGNIIPPYGASQGGESATIEYAVSVLGVRDIIVCGHSHCGAMGALLTQPESVADLPAVRAWLQHAEATRRIMHENYTHLQDEPLLSATVEENVLVQLENLRTHPLVAARLARGKLHLHGWVYKLESGQVFSYDPDQGQYTPLSRQENRADGAEPADAKSGALPAPPGSPLQAALRVAT